LYGVVDALPDLLPQHVPALRRYARALVGDVQQADDLVQAASLNAT